MRLENIIKPFRNRWVKVVISMVVFAQMYSCAHVYPLDSTLNQGQGVIEDRHIAEASGLVVSRINSDTLWTMNDSGNTATLYAVNRQGQKQATVTIAGAKNIDWEDLSRFDDQGQSYLMIADVGDNQERRKRYTLYVVKEPDLRREHHFPVTLTIRPAWSIVFMYDDGPHDCESVVVDRHQQKIMLLTKRTEMPVLYELPLAAGTHTATRLGAITPFPAPSHRYYRLLDLVNLTGLPTSMDMTADGQAVVVLTYGAAYYYQRHAGETWLAAMRLIPQEIVVPRLNQPESIGFDPHGDFVWVTSESLPAPVVKLSLPAERRFKQE